MQITKEVRHSIFLEGQEVWEAVRATLRHKGIIPPREAIVHFSSSGSITIMWDGDEGPSRLDSENV